MGKLAAIYHIQRPEERRFKFSKEENVAMLDQPEREYRYFVRYK